MMPHQREVIVAREGLYTGIDLGTSKVVTLIASVRPDGGLLVHGMGEAASDGIQKGRVVDVAAAQASVARSLVEAQRDVGRMANWTYLGVSGSHIVCSNGNSVLHRPGQTLVTREDIVRLMAESQPDIPQGKELLHHIPMDFAVDGFTGVRSPEGLEAETLEVHTHSVTGDIGPLENARNAVEACKLEVRNLVIQSIAAGEAVLSTDEQEVGVVLADIGEGTTDVIIYRGGNPWYSSVIPVGGFQVTRDLAVALGGAPHPVAEKLKIEYGHVMPGTLNPSDEVTIPPFFGKAPGTVPRKNLCEPMHDRAVEMLELVRDKIRLAGLRDLPPGGLVLTGGTAELPGMEDLARRVFHSPVRIGAPRGFPGLPGTLRQPAYSASVGVLLWGIKHQGDRRPRPGAKAGRENGGGFMSRLLHLGRSR